MVKAIAFAALLAGANVNYSVSTNEMTFFNSAQASCQTQDSFCRMTTTLFESSRESGQRNYHRARTIEELDVKQFNIELRESVPPPFTDPELPKSQCEYEALKKKNACKRMADHMGTIRLQQCEKYQEDSIESFTCHLLHWEELRKNLYMCNSGYQTDIENCHLTSEAN